MTGETSSSTLAYVLAETVARNDGGLLAITHITGARYVVLVAHEATAPLEYRQLRGIHKQWYPLEDDTTDKGGQDD